MAQMLGLETSYSVVYYPYLLWTVFIFKFNKIKNTKFNNQFEKRDVNMKFYSKSQFQSQRVNDN